MQLPTSFFRAVRNISLLAVVATGAALTAQQVSTDYDHKTDFSSYHTFSFYKVQTANPLYQQRVKDAITHDLQGKGMQMVPEGGDLAITAIGDVKNTQEYDTFYSGLGGGFGYGGWGGRYGRGGFGGGRGFGGGGIGDGVDTTTVQNIPIGTLMVDLYDTRSHNLVFRGQATEQLHQKHAEKNIAIVNKSVDKMFDKFPPKGDR